MKNKTAKQELEEALKWEREILNLMIKKLEVSNGDAQGIFEATDQQAILICYLAKKTPQETFEILFQ